MRYLTPRTGAQPAAAEGAVAGVDDMGQDAESGPTHHRLDGDATPCSSVGSALLRGGGAVAAGPSRHRDDPSGSQRRYTKAARMAAPEPAGRRPFHLVQRDHRSVGWSRAIGGCCPRGAWRRRRRSVANRPTHGSVDTAVGPALVHVHRTCAVGPRPLCRHTPALCHTRGSPTHAPGLPFEAAARGAAPSDVARGEGVAPRPSSLASPMTTRRSCRRAPPRSPAR